MKKTIIKTSLIFLGIILGVKYCNNILKYKKDKHLHTESLGHNIFKEKFKTFSGGVLMTNDYSYYITDSSTFRKFVGDCDEKELYKCQVLGDTIKVILYSKRINYGKEIPVDSAFYSIKELKRKRHFE